VNLGGGAKATELDSGTLHTCALLTDGSVKCWGYNALGQLGIGSTAQQNAPGAAVNLGGEAKATELAGGELHTCALLTGGSVKCWGYNADGQLGLGDTTSRGTTSASMGDNLPFVLLTP
jgi:alpha-tubulin suppressor-like RCC1 family protein